MGTLEKLVEVHAHKKTADCSSHGALGNPLNTISRGFREICENIKVFARSKINVYTQMTQFFFF
jgi:hypothetical protein